MPYLLPAAFYTACLLSVESRALGAGPVIAQVVATLAAVRDLLLRIAELVDSPCGAGDAYRLRPIAGDSASSTSNGPANAPVRSSRPVLPKDLSGAGTSAVRERPRSRSRSSSATRRSKTPTSGLRTSPRPRSTPTPKTKPAREPLLAGSSSAPGSHALEQGDRRALNS